MKEYKLMNGDSNITFDDNEFVQNKIKKNFPVTSIENMYLGDSAKRETYNSADFTAHIYYRNKNSRICLNHQMKENFESKTTFKLEEI